MLRDLSLEVTEAEGGREGLEQLRRLGRVDLVLVDHAGRIVEGKHPINAAAYAIHSRIHAARPDVVAAAHSHSLFCTTYASFGKLLPVVGYHMPFPSVGFVEKAVTSYRWARASYYFNL